MAIPELSGIDGVRSVTVTGENTTQLLVTLRPKDLRKHDVTAQAVTQTVQGQATVTPAAAASTRPRACRRGRHFTQHRQAVPSFAGADPDGPVRCPRSPTSRWTRSSRPRCSGRRPPRAACRSQGHRRRRGGDLPHGGHDDPGIEQKLATTPPSPIFDQAPLIEQSIHDLAVEGLLGLAFAVLVILAFLFSLFARP